MTVSGTHWHSMQVGCIISIYELIRMSILLLESQGCIYMVVTIYVGNSYVVRPGTGYADIEFIFP